MSKFNKKANQPTVTNLAGGPAFRESPHLELASIALASFAGDQYYRSGGDTVSRLAELVGVLPDKRFAAKAALYARNEAGMRSVSHVIAGEIAKLVKGEQWTRGFYANVIRRPDDATEIAAYYLGRYGKPFPNSLKKGIAGGLAKFDAYQLAKYRGGESAVKLVDLVNLAHPKPTESNAEALRKLVADELRSTDTWEARISAAGQGAEGEDEKATFKAEAWADLIVSRKLGYFALLRNLRNILEQAPAQVEAAAAMLTDETLIRKSLVLPFRFGSAYGQLVNVAGSAPLLDALGRAAEISLANVPEFEGSTLVALDVSGSMQGRPFEIGSMFAAALASKQGADVLVFSDAAAYHNLPAGLGLFGKVASLKSAANWAGTNFDALFEKATRPYDRIVILSDMQAWMGGHVPAKAFADYRKRAGANPSIFSFDLAGYGTLQFPAEKVFALAGFSDRAFAVMQLLEGDREALIHTIESVEL